MPTVVKLRRSYTSADGWIGCVGELASERETMQGADGGHPRLTVMQAIAVLMALRDFAGMHSITVAGWPDLWYRLLGHLHPNDRFIMTGAHAGSWVTGALLADTWAAIDQMALDFDRIMGTAPVSMAIDEGWNTYRLAAHLAWQRMLADRLRAGIKPPPNPFPFPSPDGLSILLALGILYYATRKRK